ncbi:MAG: hypothetical protein GF398_08940 [Chitinivibrionales bacterium]|nr:hypothetical protein [Chitinivibrionales bacterium]
MSDLVIVCSSVMADGFRLAGLEVREAENGPEMRAHLCDMSDNSVVVVPQQFVDDLPQRDRQDLVQADKPLIIPVPLEWRAAGDTRKEFANMIKKIVGFKIPLTSQVLTGSREAGS